MRVVHLITGLRTGGAENQLLLLTRHTATEPVVIALTHADEIADALRDDGVEVHDLGMRSNKDALALVRLTRLLVRLRPDVVHVHLYRATLYGRVAAWLARVPLVVTTEHSLLEGELEGRPTTEAVRRLYLATERFNDTTIAVSADVASRLERWGVPAAKVHTVPNALDLAALRVDAAQGARVRAELGIPASAQVIAGVGRLHPVKRWDLLIEAMAGDLGEHLHLLLAGSGEEETRLRDLAEARGVAPWVHLAGARTDVGAVYAAADVVASPSPRETFGLTLVEALAAGRPVVYVSSPGLEALGPVGSATRVPAEPGPLRDALLTTLRAPSGPPETTVLARYDVRSVAGRVDEIYHRGRHAAQRSGRRTEPMRRR